MKVSVIIANYNGKGFISDCLNSVLTSSYKDFEIVVVDNASTDNSLEHLKEKYGKNKKVRIIKSDKNLYFTGGCNLGAKKAHGDKLFFLNSDTAIDKNCLKELVKFARKHKKYLVQPKILWHKQKSVIDNVGGRYDFFGFGFALGRNEKDTGQYEKNFPVDYVNGTAFMIEKKFFEELGGFDEEFRYFYEDVDLALRAKQAGGKSWYFPKSIIYHKGSLTFKQNVPAKLVRSSIRRNRLLTLIKNQKSIGLLIKLPGLLLIQFLIFLKEKFFENEIIKSGSVVFIGTNIVNALNFAFTITMARLLGPKSFGEMAALFSLLILVGIPSGVIVTSMAKYISEHQAKKNFWFVKKIFKSASRLGLLIGTLLLLAFWGFTPIFSRFFHISYLPFIIFGLVFPIALLTDVRMGTLQGLQHFVPFSLTPLIATTAKFVLAVLLVYLGFSVSGVMLAFVLGLLLAYLYANSKVRLYLAKQIFVQKQKGLNLALIKKDVLAFAKTVFLTTLLLALLANADIILVKHYLTPVLAGQYASLATIGKLILYGSAPFITVMFPLVSAAHTAGKGKEKNILKKSLAIILVIALFVLLIFTFAPNLVIKTLFGQQYLTISPYLIWFGLVMLFNTLTRSFIGFFLAVHEKGFLYPLALGAALQTLLILTFHQNIFSIILSMLTANIILFLACSTIYLKTNYVKK